MVGGPSQWKALRVHDAQRVQIPVSNMRDVEIQLVDQSGRAVMLKERVPSVFFPLVWPIRTRHGPYNCVSSEKQ